MNMKPDKGNRFRDKNERSQEKSLYADDSQKLVAAFDEAWICAQMDQDATDHAFRFGKLLKEGNLSRTQVRNFFGELRRIEARGVTANADAIFHLQHKLAYTKSRLTDEKGKQAVNADVAQAFHDVLVRGLKAIGNDPTTLQIRFERFTAYFEAVLAYHRFHGGRES